MKNRELTAIHGVFLIILVLQCFTARAFDRRPWQKDFVQLQQILADDYPNLESQTMTYRLNLPKLRLETETQLNATNSGEQATKTLKNFVSAFKDGHLEIQEPNLSAQSGEPEQMVTLSKSTSGATACRSMGNWQPARVQFPFPTTKDLGFGGVTIQADAFSYAILRLGKYRVGFIRIPSFVPQKYPGLCSSEWEKFRKNLAGSCDEDCQDRFLNLKMQNKLLSEFQRTVEKLKKQNVSALVLDLTNNGGGSDWAAGVMRILTSKKILCGQFGFIKNAHWTKQFTDLKVKLKKQIFETHDGSQRDALKKKLAQDVSDLAHSKEKCDRSDVWKTSHFSCDLVVKRQLETCEPSSNLHFSTGIFDKKLFILTNKKTASASEEIVGRYKDSHTATIIGQRTLGAGCGFTNGGLDLKLANSGLVVKVPDCARYLRNGVNEVEGIEPDINLDMTNINSNKFTAELKAMLTRSLRSNKTHQSSDALAM